MWACANVGNPEGGPYDVTPPRLIKAKPSDRALGVTSQRIVLEFDEYVRLAQQEKIIISPPQVKPPIIGASGKAVSIKLIDSLRPNTTYSIYFDDAVVDNNEGNPLEDLSYSFSTGDKVDTMQIGGVVLDAETLEPVPNLVIGAYYATAWQDSSVLTKAFPFASKTDKQGRYTIRGLADSVYRVFALKDDDNNYQYNRDSEGFAYLAESFRTTKLDSIKTDTIRIDSVVRRDTLYRDSLVTKPYTYYKPKDILLRYFTPKSKRRGLERSSREDSLRITLEFADKQVRAPILHSLDSPQLKGQELYYASINERKVTYWLRPKTLIAADSVRFVCTYYKTDSLMNVVEQTDTLTFMKPRAKAESKKTSRADGEKADKVDNPLKPTFYSSKGIYAATPSDSLVLQSSLPLEEIEPKLIRLEATTDSIYKPHTFRLERDSLDVLRHHILFERRYGGKYRVKIDSAALRSIYGHYSDSVVFEQKVEEEATFGALHLTLEGLSGHRHYVAQLLDRSGNPLAKTEALLLEAQVETKSDSLSLLPAKADTLSKRDSSIAPKQDSLQSQVTARWQVKFQDLKPETYYIRLFVDENRDGEWTTGEYPERQPEVMYYSPHKYEVKKSFTTSETWSPMAVPAERQKPLELLKNKPEEPRKRVDKNKEYYKRLEDKKRPQAGGSTQGLPDFSGGLR